MQTKPSAALPSGVSGLVAQLNRYSQVLSHSGGEAHGHRSPSDQRLVFPAEPNTELGTQDSIQWTGDHVIDLKGEEAVRKESI